MIQRKRSQDGFSLIELVVVIAITLVVTAIAVPSLMNVIANARLRAAASSLSGILQDSRVIAIKQNRTMMLHFATIQAGPYAYIKDATSSDTSLTTMDPRCRVNDVCGQVQLGAPVIQVMGVPPGGSPSALGTTELGFTALDLSDTTNLPSFNSRGLPCKYVSGTCTTNGFVYYFTDIRRNAAWTAVSISPAGRIKRWFWYGTYWGS